MSHLDVAVRIGQRLCDQAKLRGDICTWEVWHSRGSDAHLAPAAGDLYQGTAGIALFLAELHRHTGEASIAEVAAAGLRHALGELPGSPGREFGAYTGKMGVATAALRIGRLLGRDEFTAAAGEILSRLSGHEHEDEGHDVLAGAAGAIPPLLRLHLENAAELPLDVDPLEMAVRLGERLLETAHREPRGWSWPVFARTSVRHLTGYSHGTAGIGLALLELAAVTGRDRYRFAAEMAFLYERQFFDPGSENWLDLRHTELSRLYLEGRGAVRQAARDSSIEPFRPKCMAAWCHGAPGIGLARLRAYQLTGQEAYRVDAETALRTTLTAMERSGPDTDFSLCHGLAGLCELPLEMSAVFDPSLREACEQRAEAGRETFEHAGRPWPCGTLEQRNDPSLMMGEAGIGYFYLRLHDAGVPPVLCPPPLPERYRLDPVPSEDYSELGRAAVEELFGETLGVLEILDGPGTAAPTGRSPAGAPITLPAPSPGSPPAESPVEACYRVLCQKIAALRGPSRAILEDAFSVERHAFEMTLALDDFTAEPLAYLLRRPWGEARSRGSGFRLADSCRLVTTSRDWTEWAAAHRSGEPLSPAAGDEDGGDE
ncbi:MAG: hypothetical protein MI919_11985, partial [Holophagales bacterium]|nr:hypothetical protein [Holophagales bacterium]